MQTDTNNNTDMESDAFTTVICDLVADLATTFPEYTPLVAKWWKPEGQGRENSIKFIRKFCTTQMSPLFLNIMYRDEASLQALEVLPRIYFKDLWLNSDADTQEVLWKYLGLIVVCVSQGGDSNVAAEEALRNFADSINPEELQAKLEEAVRGLPPGDQDQEDTVKRLLEPFLGGKLGKMALEMVDEMKEDFEGLAESASMQDALKAVTQNPQKLMGLAKKMNAKMDQKIKAGEISESEIRQEATEMLGRFQDMPGIGEMLRGFGGTRKEKPNVPAMEAKLDQLKRQEATKLRMRNNVNKKKQQQQQFAASADAEGAVSALVQEPSIDELVAMIDAKPGKKGGKKSR
jgi:hypothetical protein